jgi:hypothetical protein
MSFAQRVSLVAAALMSTLLVFIVLQGATQEIETRTDRDRAGNITATDAAGNDTTKTWTFKVIRR